VTTAHDISPEHQLHGVRSNADRLLAFLLVLHFPAALALAPLHGSWLAAIVVGGGLSGLAVFVSRAHAGTFFSRCTMMFCFLGYSALLVSETHGMIELHFHIFGALAFMLIYRDWRVPVVGAVLVALHHVGFELLQAGGANVYVMPPTDLHLPLVLLHAVFVVFEVSVLVLIARTMEEETVTLAHLRAGDAAERAQLADLATALERRDLRVGGGGEGAAAVLQAGIGQVASLVQSIQTTAEELSATSREVSSASSESERSSAEIADAITSVASLTEQQARVVAEAGDAAGDASAAVAEALAAAESAAAAAREALADAERGIATADGARAAMAAVEESSGAITEASEALARRSGEITGFVVTIRTIAEQTNLLALNAAIEAARAGEQGRGFAVVAEEVRQLAENAQAAAGDIATLVRDVQSKTEQAVAVVEEGARRTTEGSSTVGTAHDAFRRLGGSVEDMSARVEEIATALGEIADAAGQMQVSVSDVAAVAEESSASMQQVSAATEQTAASSREISDAAGGMAETAESLEALVGRFRLVP
jgi:methyl-accepting chemotaxis protein